jgi:aquaporin Z
MQSYLVEFVGSLFLMYVFLTLKNPLANGVALTLAMLLSLKVSGGYFNPALTMAMVYNGTLPNKELLPYILAQITGALSAVEIIKKFN